MIVTVFLLRQVLETNSNLVKKLIEEVIRWKRKYELTKELLSKGISKDDIINNYGIQELFIYLAE